MNCELLPNKRNNYARVNEARVPFAIDIWVDGTEKIVRDKRIWQIIGSTYFAGTS